MANSQGSWRNFPFSVKPQRNLERTLLPLFCDVYSKNFPFSQAKLIRWGSQGLFLLNLLFGLLGLNFQFLLGNTWVKGPKTGFGSKTPFYLLLGLFLGPFFSLLFLPLLGYLFALPNSLGATNSFWVTFFFSSRNLCLIYRFGGSLIPRISHFLFVGGNLLSLRPCDFPLFRQKGGLFCPHFLKSL